MEDVSGSYCLTASFYSLHNLAVAFHFPHVSQDLSVTRGTNREVRQGLGHLLLASHSIVMSAVSRWLPTNVSCILLNLFLGFPYDHLQTPIFFFFWEPLMYEVICFLCEIVNVGISICLFYFIMLSTSVFILFIFCLHQRA